MTDTTPDLAALLAAATDPETKAEPTVDELLVRNAELEAQLLAQQTSDDVDEDLAAGMADVQVGEGRPREPGDDGTDDVAAVGAQDFDDYDDDEDEGGIGDALLTAPTEGKAAGWAPCPECGRPEADEYVDGTARCEHDGTPLTRLEGKADEDGYDFDDVEEVLEEKALGDDEAVVELGSLAELQARRAALEGRA